MRKNKTCAEKKAVSFNSKFHKDWTQTRSLAEITK